MTRPGRNEPLWALADRCDALERLCEAQNARIAQLEAEVAHIIAAEAERRPTVNLRPVTDGSTHLLRLVNDSPTVTLTPKSKRGAA